MSARRSRRNRSAPPEPLPKQKKTAGPSASASRPPSPSSMDNSGRADRFVPERLLGAGGVCEVHAALDLRRLEWSDATPHVALKRLLPNLACNRQAQLALAQEFCLLRHLTHPGVIRVFDLHCEPFGPCYSMELLRGRPLNQALESPTKDFSAVPAAARLFDVLAFLHAQGVAHGDIKPSNIFLEPGCRPVLIDFNVANAILDENAPCDRSTASRGLRAALHLPAHNLLYSAPERLNGGPPTAADDVFAACCSVYEFFSGEHPFCRRSSAEAQSLNLRPPRPTGLPLPLWPALRKGLNFQAKERPTANNLRRAFAAWGIAIRCTSRARGFFSQR